MSGTNRTIWIAFLLCAFTGLPPALAETDPGLILTVKTRKAEINWKSWSRDFEPLHIQADNDDSIVIFRFETLPANPEKIGVTSNAAVYIKSGKGFIPITERARQNPQPDLDQEIRIR